MQRVDRRLAVIIEDDAAIALGVSLRLKHEGFETLTAEDGASGLDLIFEHHPELVVLDVRMPKMNGLQVLRQMRLKMSESAPPVLMLSASLQDEQAALDAGAAYFLSKPYRSSALVDAIHSLQLSIHL